MLPVKTTGTFNVVLAAFKNKNENLELVQYGLFYSGKTSCWGATAYSISTAFGQNDVELARWVGNKIVFNQKGYEEHLQWYKDNPDYNADPWDMRINTSWEEVKKLSIPT